MRHTDEAKRKIGEAARLRNSAATALIARWRNRQKVCSVDGCNKPHEALGYCNMHYQRLKKTGSLGDAKSTRGDDGYVNAYGYRVHNSKAAHIKVVESALGKTLPKGAVVHHVNEDKLDNRPNNLVVCPDKAYHNLIHARTRALTECGNADWLKCPFCGKYDDPLNMYVYPNKRSAKHRECYAAYRKRSCQPT